MSVIDRVSVSHFFIARICISAYSFSFMFVCSIVRLQSVCFIVAIFCSMICACCVSSVVSVSSCLSGFVNVVAGVRCASMSDAMCVSGIRFIVCIVAVLFRACIAISSVTWCFVCCSNRYA